GSPHALSPGRLGRPAAGFGAARGRDHRARRRPRFACRLDACGSCGPGSPGPRARRNRAVLPRPEGGVSATPGPGEEVGLPAGLGSACAAAPSASGSRSVARAETSVAAEGLGPEVSGSVRAKAARVEVPSSAEVEAGPSEEVLRARAYLSR